MILIISDYHKREDKVLDLIAKYNPTHILCCGDGESEDEFYTKTRMRRNKANNH